MTKDHKPTNQSESERIKNAGGTVEWGRVDGQLALSRARLAPALLLVGEWVGEGHAHGEPVVATMRVRLILGDTVLEVWERVGDHEDLSLYRYDPADQQRQVLHLMAGALAEHPVELTPDGLVWVTPPHEPAVVWSIAGADVVSEVVLPGQRVAEVRLRYRRG